VERSSGAAPPRQTGGSDKPGDGAGQRLAISVEEEGKNISVVALSGELDLSTIPLLERRLLDEVRSTSAVVVDLTDVSFIDSSGIALLIQAFRAGEDTERLHTVIADGSQVERVFRLAGIDRALPLHMDRHGAIGALNGSVSD
jgi:anti-sigma B factor antagonist